MTETAHTWWAMLCAVATLNILAWTWTAATFKRRASAMPQHARATHRLQLLLAAGYVFGCAYRSFMPVFDIPRQCMFDSPMCSALIGRTVATVAELCFAAQWALILRDMAQNLGRPITRFAAMQIVPLIVIAEFCSWYSVLSTSNLGHTFEETLWGVCAVIVAAGLLSCWPRCSIRQRTLVGLCAAAAAAYAIYMFAVDVPMYWHRWLADEAAGRQYLRVAQGVVDAASRWTVSAHWSDWKSEVVWMSLYFSVGVWLSIGLVHAPVFEPLGARQGVPRLQRELA